MQKNNGPNRYLQISTVGFRSGGLDLMGSGSNLVRPLWIGRLGFNPRGETAARYRRRGIPRRRAGEPAGEGQTGVLGVGLGRGLAGDDQHDVANPPVHLGRGFRGSDRACHGEGRRWRGRLPACGARPTQWSTA